MKVMFKHTPALLPGQVSSTYERCCVLFNIGSLQSQIAKSQNFDSDEGIKNAAKHFQVYQCVCVLSLSYVPPYSTYTVCGRRHVCIVYMYM